MDFVNELLIRLSKTYVEFEFIQYLGYPGENTMLKILFPSSTDEKSRITVIKHRPKEIYYLPLVVFQSC